jgi:hypothetical protein
MPAGGKANYRRTDTGDDGDKAAPARVLEGHRPANARTLKVALRSGVVMSLSEKGQRNHIERSLLQSDDLGPDLVCID